MAGKKRTPPREAISIGDAAIRPPGKYDQFGYHAADEQRTSGRLTPQGGSGDRQDRWDRRLLRDMSARFDRDNPIQNALISRALDNIVGHGFKLQMNTGDEAKDKAIQDQWCDWWKRPEVRKLDAGWQVERHVLASCMRDGDIAAIKLGTDDIQLIEAERIYHPNVKKPNDRRVEDGILLDSVGRPLSMYVCDYSANGMVQRRTTGKVYPWEKVVFVAHRRRVSQTRGMPVHVPAFPMLHRLNEICDSEAIAWQLLARFALSVNRENGPTLAYNESTAKTGLPTNPNQEERPERSQDIGTAILFHGEEGEEIKGIERNLPGSDFPESVRMFLRLIGMPFGMPLELLLLDFSQTNYSSAKASLEQAYRAFRAWQRLLWENFHDPLLSWKLAEWYPELKNKTHTWITPNFPWLDPLKEAEAAGLGIALGLTTHGEAIAGRGGDREAWLRERQKEYLSAYKVQQEIAKQCGGYEPPIELLVGLNDKVLAQTAKVEAAEVTADASKDKGAFDATR
ncbi:MAG: phage portal protein [bacterium]|nr:phage portal protein [bacterium]